jgi:hypothetical protein
MSTPWPSRSADKSRTVIPRIELGNRPVSPDELAKLASVYRRAVIDLLGEPVEEDDVLLILLDLAPNLVEAIVQEQPSAVPRSVPRSDGPSERTRLVSAPWPFPNRRCGTSKRRGGGSSKGNELPTELLHAEVFKGEQPRASTTAP